MESQMMPLAQLQPAEWNPRGELVDADLSELVASVQVHGVLTPLLVRGDGALDSIYEIVAGHRRFRAAQLAGLTEVPVVVLDVSDAEAREVAIVENLQREDIRPLEEARAFKALVDAGSAPAAVARRVGKSERYVWDRLRLLQLVPEAAVLLDTDRITVQHAIVLAKLTPADQARVIDPETGGLFTDEKHFLDDDGDGPEEPVRWAGLKPVSVRELQQYIATRVRFDPAQAAAAAPLDFGPVAEQVEAAQAQTKRGRKVVHITRDYYVQPDARSTERTYCVKAWKRADGQEKSQTCDRSVLGVVVVGPGYGEAFPVCVHKECDVHWKAERLAREKEQARRGPTSKKGDRAREDAELRKNKERQAKAEADRKAWETEKRAAAAALAKHVRTIPFSEAVVRDILLDKWDIARVKEAFGVPLTKQTALAVLILRRVDLSYREGFEFSTKALKFTWPPKEKPAAAKAVQTPTTSTKPVTTSIKRALTSTRAADRFRGTKAAKPAKRRVA